MADMINMDGLLVSREREQYGICTIKIGFTKPISDEAMRLLALFAKGIEWGEDAMARKLGIGPKEC